MLMPQLLRVGNYPKKIQQMDETETGVEFRVSIIEFRVLIKKSR
jgi:hypothetical protein